MGKFKKKELILKNQTRIRQRAKNYAIVESYSFKSTKWNFITANKPPQSRAEMQGFVVFLKTYT
jgi:hypothetical protein